MTMGFTPDFFMRAAGAVEFALAFSLMWTPLVRRVGATMLAAMFVSAVFEFGKIDLIGHSLIVVALVGIVADDGGKPVAAAPFLDDCRSAMRRRWRCSWRPITRARRAVRHRDPVIAS